MKNHQSKVQDFRANFIWSLFKLIHKNLISALVVGMVLIFGFIQLAKLLIGLIATSAITGESVLHFISLIFGAFFTGHSILKTLYLEYGSSSIIVLAVILSISGLLSAFIMSFFLELKRLDVLQPKEAGVGNALQQITLKQLIHLFLFPTSLFIVLLLVFAPFMLIPTIGSESSGDLVSLHIFLFMIKIALFSYFSMKLLFTPIFITFDDLNIVAAVKKSWSAVSFRMAFAYLSAMSLTTTLLTIPMQIIFGFAFVGISNLELSPQFYELIITIMGGAFIGYYLAAQFSVQVGFYFQDVYEINYDEDENSTAYDSLID